MCEAADRFGQSAVGAMSRWLWPVSAIPCHIHRTKFTVLSRFIDGDVATIDRCV